MNHHHRLILALALTLGTWPAWAQTNLLINGDFEQGNTGFSSAYHFNGQLGSEGFYAVLADPHDVHPLASSIHDHTSGSGQMLTVNGGNDPSNTVWTETVTVTPNTTYLLSGWGASWGQNGDGKDPSPALLTFSVNGTQLGAAVQIPSKNGVWQSFTAVWNSGDSTQAMIQIFDLNPAWMGNDFGLDDLVFAPLSGSPFLAPSVNGVKESSAASPAVVPPTTDSSPTIYNSVEINWASTPNVTYQVQWSPSLSESNWFNLGNPVAATGPTSSAWDRVAPGSRFYRVLVFQ